MKQEGNPKKTASSTEPANKKILKRSPPGKKAFPVVGIGAFAGGLKPLEAFFAKIPSDKPPSEDMAFVVI